MPSKPILRVEWQHTPDAGEYGRVLLTNIAGGTSPDTSFILTDQYETLRQSGALLDITDQITSDPLLGQPDYFMAQEAVRCADNNGRWHGIGSCWVAHHLYYNAAVFEEAGITPPGFGDDEIWDWDNFVSYLQTTHRRCQRSNIQMMLALTKKISSVGLLTGPCGGCR